MKTSILRNLMNLFSGALTKNENKRLIIDGNSFKAEDVEIINKYMYFNKKNRVYFFYDNCSLIRTN